MSSKKYDMRSLRLFNKRVAHGTTRDQILNFLEALDCPRALTVAILLRYGEDLQVAQLSFNPDHYNTISDLADAYGATKICSKYSGLSTGLDLDQVALDKFASFEENCRITNRRFKDLGKDPLFNGPIVWIHNVTMQKISSVLGAFNPQDFLDLGGWGPGASTSIKRRDASGPNKFQHEAGITQGLYDLLFPHGNCAPSIMDEFPNWSAHLRSNGFPKFELGNKIITVPKDATTNRVIAIEPGFNIWFQLAIGNAIGLRLRRCGIDIRDQTRNQQLARKGSIDSSLATVDFSSASDSISRMVVQELFSYEPAKRWFLLMDATRSHFGSQQGKTLYWEKFSSMGNGFTFQLETLIFYAIAFATCEYLGLDTADVSAYGDDVIIPSGALSLFHQACSFYGFTVNLKKSHSGLSPFRESCGSHWYKGSDVKPPLQKEVLTDVPSVYRMANRIRLYAHRRWNYSACDARFASCFYRLVNLVPRAFRFKVSAQLGDVGFISNFDEARPTRARRYIEGYFCRALVDRALTNTVDYEGLLLARLHKGSDRELNNNVALSGRTRKAVKLILVSQWYDLGPWL